MGREGKYDLRLAHAPSASTLPGGASSSSSSSPPQSRDEDPEQSHQCSSYLPNAVDVRSPRSVLLALCDSFLVSHYLQLTVQGRSAGSALSATARTWRKTIERRYDRNQVLT